MCVTPRGARHTRYKNMSTASVAETLRQLNATTFARQPTVPSTGGVSVSDGVGVTASPIPWKMILGVAVGVIVTLLAVKLYQRWTAPAEPQPPKPSANEYIRALAAALPAQQRPREPFLSDAAQLTDTAPPPQHSMEASTAPMPRSEGQQPAGVTAPPAPPPEDENFTPLD